MSSSFPLKIKLCDKQQHMTTFREKKGMQICFQQECFKHFFQDPKWIFN
jgi:hypothetical protein